MGKHHGLNKTPEHRAWVYMKLRCYNERNHNYHRYGGRGISVCDRWRESFVNFLADLGTRPSKNHTLDRIDSDGNYEPGNCRWVTRQVQNINRRICRVNTSGYRGVNFHKRARKWEASISVNNKRIYLGVHSNKDDAARAYDEAAKKFYGAEAKLNFPEEQ